MEQSGTAQPPAQGGPGGGVIAGFSTIEDALARIAAGGAVVVVDEHDREDEGDLVFAAEMATAELAAFMMSQRRGLIWCRCPGKPSTVSSSPRW